MSMGMSCSPNLRIMFCRWDSTVRGEMLKSEAISLVEKPSTMSCRTSVFPGSQELDEGIAGFGEDKFGLRAGADVPEGENRAGHGSSIIPEWGGSNRPYRK